MERGTNPTYEKYYVIYIRMSQVRSPALFSRKIPFHVDLREKVPAVF